MRSSSLAIGLVWLANVLMTQAQTGAVRVAAVAGVQGVLEEVKPQCEREIGRSVAVDFYSTSAAAGQRIQTADSFDLAILLSPVVDAMTTQGRLAASGRAEFARSGVGVAIRAGARRRNVATPLQLREVLLSAKSVTYVTNGASRAAIEAAFADLGVSNDMKSRTVLAANLDEWGRAIAEGRVDVGFTLVSDTLFARGVDFVGLLPENYQRYVSFAIAASPVSANDAAVQALIRCLMGPAVDQVLTRKGMQRSN